MNRFNPSTESEFSTNRTERRHRLTAAGAIAAIGIAALTGCSAEGKSEAPTSSTEQTIATPDTTVEAEPTEGSLEFRESDLTPDVLASLSDAEIIERMQIPVAEHPTVEDWAEKYVLRDNDLLRSGTAPSEITLMYDQGIDAMNANVDRYASLFGQALNASPVQHEASDVLKLAVTNATLANSNGEEYVIRQDLESVAVTAGSVEEGVFSVNITVRRQDNMGDLEITKTEIYDDTGNKLRTLSADVDVNMNVDVINVDGLWKTTRVSVLSSTPHGE